MPVSNPANRSTPFSICASLRSVCSLAAFSAVAAASAFRFIELGQPALLGFPFLRSLRLAPGGHLRRGRREGLRFIGLGQPSLLGFSLLRASASNRRVSARTMPTLVPINPPISTDQPGSPPALARGVAARTSARGSGYSAAAPPPAPRPDPVAGRAGRWPSRAAPVALLLQALHDHPVQLAARRRRQPSRVRLPQHASDGSAASVDSRVLGRGGSSSRRMRPPPAAPPAAAGATCGRSPVSSS